MKQHSQKVVAVMLGYFNIIIHNLSTLFLTPTMISEWGGASYGLYKIILSFLTYFMLIDSGIRSSVYRFVAEYRAQEDRDGERRYITVISSYYIMAIIVLSAIVFVFSIFVPKIYAQSLSAREIEILLSALPLLLVSTISALFFNTFSALLKGHNLQAVVQSINVIRSILRFVVLFTMVRSGSGVSETLFVETAIAVVFAAIVLGYVFFIEKLPPLFKGINKRFIKNIVSFTSVMLLYTIATSLFWTAGNFLVGVMTSSILAAVYATAITLTNMFQSLAGIISQVLVPDIMLKSYTHNDMPYMNSLMIRMAKIKLPIMMLLVLGFGLFGRQFVYLWVGDGYVGAYIIAFITMVPLMFGLLQDVPNNYALAKNKQKILAIAATSGCLFNVLISVVLIRFWGIYGAGLCTMITYVLVNIVFTYWYYTKEFGFNMKSLYRETVGKNIKYICLLVGFGLALNAIPFDRFLGSTGYLGWISLLIKILLFSVAFIVLFFMKMIDKEEKENILKRLGR